jgi:DNA mismatch endonuclease, patch repair protein
MKRHYETMPVGQSPRPTSAAVSRSMKANKPSGTQPELTLSRLLRKKIGSEGLPGSPDFVYPRSKLAIFVHGDFWHRCPTCDLPLPKIHAAYWKRKFERNIERDQLVRAELEGMGWRVMVIWEHEVRDDPSLVAQRVRQLVSAGSLGKRRA